MWVFELTVHAVVVVEFMLIHLPDGVHVIHQLTQAGRTLVAVLLNCKCDCGRQGEAPSEANPARPNCRCGLEHLIPSAMDALRSCVGLLRRFSGRYVCGLRSGDLMEEFCRCEYSLFGLLSEDDEGADELV